MFHAIATPLKHEYRRCLYSGALDLEVQMCYGHEFLFYGQQHAAAMLNNQLAEATNLRSDGLYLQRGAAVLNQMQRRLASKVSVSTGLLFLHTAVSNSSFCPLQY